jgi:hypothetical protein
MEEEEEKREPLFIISDRHMSDSEGVNLPRE